MDPRQQAAYGRIGALTRLGREDPAEMTRKARQGFLTRFEREVEAETPDLPANEKRRRAEARLRAHMARLSVKRWEK